MKFDGERTWWDRWFESRLVLIIPAFALAFLVPWDEEWIFNQSKWSFKYVLLENELISICVIPEFTCSEEDNLKYGFLLVTLT